VEEDAMCIRFRNALAEFNKHHINHNIGLSVCKPPLFRSGPELKRVGVAYQPG
jgi:hypothetical protein